MFLGDRLKKLRTKFGLSQTQAAKAIGVADSTYSEYEKDTNNKTPSPAKLIKLASLFNTSTDYLLGRTENPLPIGEDKLDLDQILKNPVTFQGKEIPVEDLDFFLSLLQRLNADLMKKQRTSDND